MNQSRWQRVGRDHPCPICERCDWCLISPDGSAAICPRVSEGAIRQVGDSGWLHRLHDRTDWRPGGEWRRATSVVASKPRRDDLDELVRDFLEAATPHHLERFAGKLGVSVESLDRLSAGWCSSSSAWAFPMTDGRGRVLGIRLRTDSGKKFAIKGGSEGLFVPKGLQRPGTLLLAEGPTDTAALLDLGFDAVGRPNDRGGKKLLVALIKRQQPGSVVIVADRDIRDQGLMAANLLAGVLALYHRDVRVLVPPPQVKDARDWVRSGGGSGDVLRAISTSLPVACTVRSSCNKPVLGREGFHAHA